MTAELEWLRREGSREDLRAALADALAAARELGDRLWWRRAAAELGRLRRLADVLVNRLPTREARTLDRLLGELAELATRAPAGGSIRMWLDDDLVGGTPPDPAWLQVTTAHEAIALLATGRVTELSLDHDLGDERRAGTGYDVVAWLAGRGEAAGHDLWPRSTLAVHSANGSATPGIERMVDRCAPLERVPGHPRRWRRRAR